MITLAIGCVYIQFCFAGVLALVISWPPNQTLLSDKLRGDELHFLSLLNLP